MATQRYQAFQHGDGPIVRLSVHENKALGYFYNQLVDILSVFPKADRFRANGIILLCMEDDNENNFDPKRIPFRPGSIIEIVAQGEEFPPMSPSMDVSEFPVAIESQDPDDADHDECTLNYRGPQSHSSQDKTKPKFIPTAPTLSNFFVLAFLPGLPDWTAGDDFLVRPGPSLPPPPPQAAAAPSLDDVVLKVPNTTDKVISKSSAHVRSLFRVLSGSTNRQLDLTFDWEFDREDLASLVHQLASTNVSEFKLDLREHLEDDEHLMTIRPGKVIYQPLLSLFSNTRLQSIVLANVYNLGERTFDPTTTFGSSALRTFHFLGFISENDQPRLANILSSCPYISDLALGTHLKESDGMQSVLNRAIRSLTRLEYLHLYSMDTILATDGGDNSSFKNVTKNAFKGDINDNSNSGYKYTYKTTSGHNKKATFANKYNFASKNLLSQTSNFTGSASNKFKTNATTTTTITTIAASNSTTASNNRSNGPLDAQQLTELVHTGGDIDLQATSDIISRSANKIKVLLLPRLSDSSSGKDASLELHITTTTAQSRSRDKGRPNSPVLPLNNLAFSKLTHLDLSVKLTKSSHGLLTAILSKQDLVHLGINCDSVGLLDTACLIELKSLSLLTVSEESLKPLFSAVLGRGDQCKFESMRFDRIWGTIKWLPDVITAVALTRLYLVDMGKPALMKMLNAVDLSRLELLVIDDKEYDWATEGILVARAAQFRSNLVVQLGFKSHKSERNVLYPGSRGDAEAGNALPRYRVKVDSSAQLYDEYLRSVLPTRA
ncbi:hypothetical protein BGW39_003801 [Mortierella sp. 14UC]|nr:hypothetical protein BGW39_003801 [Mortierella sp. 14UC]